MFLDRKRIAFFILLLAVLGLIWFLNNANSPMLISNAYAVHLRDNVYAVYLTMENTGQPDVITDVNANAASNASIMGGTRDEGLAIPEGAKPSFSSDGAHIMLQLGENLAEGAFIPLTLNFKNSGPVPLKAIVRETPQMSSTMAPSADQDAKMDHSMHAENAVFVIEDAQTAPKIEVSVNRGDDEKWIVSVKTENFEFFEPTVEPLVHEDGRGHGHLYLNGLKLQRMYNGQAQIGALPPGKHIISVTLNTNDHKTYSVGGNPIVDFATIESN